jgi:hypothetical protein
VASTGDEFAESLPWRHGGRGEHDRIGSGGEGALR